MPSHPGHDKRWMRRSEALRDKRPDGASLRAPGAGNRRPGPRRDPPADRGGGSHGSSRMARRVGRRATEVPRAPMARTSSVSPASTGPRLKPPSPRPAGIVTENGADGRLEPFQPQASGKNPPRGAPGQGRSYGVLGALNDARRTKIEALRIANHEVHFDVAAGLGSVATPAGPSHRWSASR